MARRCVSTIAIPRSREEIAAQIADERGAVLVPSFDDPMIIAGQGTLGLEFAAQVKAQNRKLDHLICCTGGGGLVDLGNLLGAQQSKPGHASLDGGT